MEGLYKELGEEIGRRAGGPAAGDIAETLNTIGADLYEKLFPDELREIWEERIRGNVRSIMIISDEPWIPWEMVKPSYEADAGDYVEDAFLCETYLLTRWIGGSPPPSAIKVSRGALIAPGGSNLPNVAREVEFMTAGDLGDVQSIIPRLNAVRAMLGSGGYELIHFAGHGQFDRDTHEQSTLFLERGDEFKARDIAGRRKTFGKDRPFVFINACQTARADLSLVGIGSWADKFINAKASVFLGSAWQVNDLLAYDFSKAFYGALLEGKPVGEALKLARLEIKEETNPTWLAYTMYADPLATVSFA